MTRTVWLNKTAVKDDYLEDLYAILKWCHGMIIDGDGNPDLPFKFMKEYGFIDENEEWIYNEKN